MTASMTLPQSLTTGPSLGWDSKSDRTIKTFYPLGESVETPEGTTQTGVEVSTHHSQYSKGLVTSMNRVTRQRKGVFSVTSSAPMDGVRLQTEPVARYSEKALKAAHEKALDLLQYHVEMGTPKVVGYFQVEEGGEA